MTVETISSVNNVLLLLDVDNRLRILIITYSRSRSADLCFFLASHKI